MKNIITILFFSVSLYGASQQDALYTQYMFNHMSINPAYTGTADVLNITSASRLQWVGIEGAPITNALSANSPIKSTNLGVGLSLYNDVLGPINQTGIYGNVAYQFKVSKKSKISLGIKGGVNSINVGLEDVAGVEDTDPYFQQNEVLGFKPNFGFGIYYFSDKHYLGLSAPKLLERSSNGDIATFFEKRHYFLSGGLALKLNRNLIFKPTFLVRYVQNAPISVDGSINFLIKEKVWLGAMYRNGDAVAGIFQLQLSNQFKIGYSYDFTISKLKSYNTGSHEITLSYDFAFAKKNIMSPRLF